MGHGLWCIGMRARPGASAEERECRQSGADLERHSQRSLLASQCQSHSQSRAQRMILVTDIDTSRSRERVSPPSSPFSSHAAAPPRSFLPPLLHRCLRRRRPRQTRPARCQTQWRDQARRQLVQASHEPEEDLVCGRAVHCLGQEEEMWPLQVRGLAYTYAAMSTCTSGSLTRTGMQSQSHGLRCPLRSVTITSSLPSTLTML